MTTPPSREVELTEKCRYWKQHIDAWQDSGLTQRYLPEPDHVCRKVESVESGFYVQEPFYVGGLCNDFLQSGTYL